MLPCLNKMLFGFECLGCGLQRALLLLLQGKFVSAFFMYPAIYPLTILLSFVVVNMFSPIKYYSKIVTGLSIVVAVTMVLSYMLKHL